MEQLALDPLHAEGLASSFTRLAGFPAKVPPSPTMETSDWALILGGGNRGWATTMDQRLFPIISYMRCEGREVVERPDRVQGLVELKLDVHPPGTNRHIGCICHDASRVAASERYGLLALALRNTESTLNTCLSKVSAVSYFVEERTSGY